MNRDHGLDATSRRLFVVLEFLIQELSATFVHPKGQPRS
jgi:hypothetical protein